MHFDTTVGAAPESVARATVLPRLVLADDAPALERGSRSRYLERERLGVGGLGEVTLATDEDIGRDVAIKRLRETDDGATMRFVDEVQVMGRLDHPNIVPVHDVGCDPDGRLFIVMKRLEGDTLATIIERLRDGDPETVRRYPISVRIEIVMSVLRALQYAHSRRVIHRDIKPANVMIGRFGEVILLDWGIAKRLGDPLSAALDRDVPARDEAHDEIAGRPFRTRVGSLLGTPAYMSPEQARGDNELLDERTDIFSVSVLLYELVTLHHPFADKTNLAELLVAIRGEEPKQMALYSSWRHGSIGAELSNLVHCGLAKHAEDRFASVGEMIEALHDVVDGTYPVTCPNTLAKRSLSAIARVIDAYPRVAGYTITFGALGAVVALGVKLVGWIA